MILTFLNERKHPIVKPTLNKRRRLTQMMISKKYLVFSKCAECSFHDDRSIDGASECCLSHIVSFAG